MADQKEWGGLFNFFADCLQDIYSAEKKIVKCAAGLSIAAVTPELQQTLLSMSRDAEMHVARLIEVFTLLNLQPSDSKCRIVETLSEKSAEVMKTVPTGTALRDAAIIYTVQLIAHYKIACYGSLISLLEEIGNDQAEVLMERCLADEKHADSHLTDIAIHIINPAASLEDNLN